MKKIIVTSLLCGAFTCSLQAAVSTSQTTPGTIAPGTVQAAPYRSTTPGSVHTAPYGVTNSENTAPGTIQTTPYSAQPTGTLPNSPKTLQIPAGHQPSAGTLPNASGSAPAGPVGRQQSLGYQATQNSENNSIAMNDDGKIPMDENANVSGQYVSHTGQAVPIEKKMRMIKAKQIAINFSITISERKLQAGLPIILKTSYC